MLKFSSTFAILYCFNYLHLLHLLHLQSFVAIYKVNFDLFLIFYSNTFKANCRIWYIQIQYHTQNENENILINRQIKKVFSMKHEMLYNMKSHHILTVYAFPFVLTLKHLEVDWNMILISVRPASIRWKYIFFFYHFLSFNNCKVCNAY